MGVGVGALRASGHTSIGHILAKGATRAQAHASLVDPVPVVVFRAHIDASSVSCRHIHVPVLDSSAYVHAPSIAIICESGPRASGDALSGWSVGEQGSTRAGFVALTRMVVHVRQAGASWNAIVCGEVDRETR